MDNKKRAVTFWITATSLQVGVTGLEPATSRPPDAYSKPTELHPVLDSPAEPRGEVIAELRVQKYGFFLKLQTFSPLFCDYVAKKV